MKKKKRPSGQRPSRAMTGELVVSINQAAVELERGNLTKAATLLADLERRYPNDQDVLSLLLNLAVKRQDSDSYQRVGERLMRLIPQDRDLVLAVAHATLSNMRLSMALRSFRLFVQRWPDDPRTAGLRTKIADLETAVNQSLADYDIESGSEFAIQHEEINLLLAQGKWGQVRNLSESVLKRKPNFLPVLNNLSLAYWFLGEMQLAIVSARRVLALDPDNVHAISNLIRFLVLSGETEQATLYGAQLKTLRSNRLDVWDKKVEAFSYLGDDQAVLDAFRAARRAHNPASTPLLYHLAAVAAFRLGRESAARRHWREALDLQQDFYLAQGNLDDLRRPVGERHAPWPFLVEYWVPESALQQLRKSIHAAVDQAERGRPDDSLLRFIAEYPPFTQIIPQLLDRGDPVGRELAVRAAILLHTPELLTALRDFALGQRGPDVLRQQAAQAAQRAGMLGDSLVHLWLGGKWHDVMMLGMEVTGEPDLGVHTPEVEALMQEATEALHDREAVRAEGLIRQALALEPNAPDISNNLAVARGQQGYQEESEAIVQNIHERFPDYFFARVAVARIMVRNGQIDEAAALIEPLLRQKRLHISEFRALVGAQLQLLVARGQFDAIEAWLKLWAETDPDNEDMENWRMRLAVLRLPERLAKLGIGRSKRNATPPASEG